MSTQARYIKGKYSWLKHLDFILLDMLALVLAFVLAFVFKFGSFFFLKDPTWKAILVIACLLNLSVILFSNPFSGIFRRYGSEECVKTLCQALYNFVLCCIILYTFKWGEAYSRTVVIVMYLLYFALSLCFRIVWKGMIKSGRVMTFGNSMKTIIVIGEKKEMPQLLRSINSGFFLEYDVRGVCLTDGEVGEKIVTSICREDVRGRAVENEESFENVAKVEDVAKYVLKNRIDSVFVSTTPTNIDPEVYRELVSNGKGVHVDIHKLIGFSTEDQFVTTVGTHKALSVGAYSFTGKQLVYLFVKRSMDIFFGLIGLIGMLPLTAVVKIAYLLTGDRKSIFYTQTRVGLNGKRFKLLKFRTMVYNAEEILQEMLKDEKKRAEWEKNQKFEDDPRITKMGAFLRKTSLDEVPQFLNVLRGDMSLIGPRPLVVNELEAHNGLQLYNQVKPGITGWWGCNGRSNTTYDERLELEYYYVKNCSIQLDTLCIVKTIAAVLKGDGAV